MIWAQVTSGSLQPSVGEVFVLKGEEISGIIQE